MPRYLPFIVVHATLTVSGWYFVSAAAQGAADGAGTAPAWLLGLDAAVDVLMSPILLLVLSFYPGLGGFSIESFLALTAIAVANSIVVALIVYAAIAGLRLLRTRQP